MKDTIEIYKSNLKEFLKDKKFMAILIVVSILAYGFTLTNITVGVDDLSVDRYVNDTYILSQGRWGTFLIYNILGIREFTPFWLDFVTLLILVSTAIFLCAFFKRVSDSKLKKSSYIIFACGMISCPIISHFFAYQPTKLTVALSNLLISIAIALIYENFIKGNNKKLNIISVLLLLVSISMYEACAQTFLVLIFMTGFIYFLVNKGKKFKDILNFYIQCFVVLIISVIAFFITKIILLKILEMLGLKRINYAISKSIIDLLKICEPFEIYIKLLLRKFTKIFSNNTFLIFLVMSLIGLVLSIIDSARNKDDKILGNYLLLIICNFLLIVYIYANLFRTCYSWAVSIGFILLYINETLGKSKFKILTTILVGYIILIQTKMLNSNFYNEYLEYRRNVLYVNNTIGELLKIDSNLSKPIWFVSENSNSKIDFKLTEENRKDYLEWGLTAFNENQVETERFFNYIGYEIKIVEDSKKASNIYENLDETIKEQNIIELDDFIIVKLDI